MFIRYMAECCHSRATPWSLNEVGPIHKLWPHASLSSNQQLLLLRGTWGVGRWNVTLRSKPSHALSYSLVHFTSNTDHQSPEGHTHSTAVWDKEEEGEFKHFEEVWTVVSRVRTVRTCQLNTTFKHFEEVWTVVSRVRTVRTCQLNTTYTTVH